MNSKRDCEAANEMLDVAGAGTGAIELVAVITAMVCVACIAAALLLTTPATLEAAARTSSIDSVINPGSAERPFHERYPVNATGDAIDPPTF
jgi:hypothetical protein